MDVSLCVCYTFYAEQSSLFSSKTEICFSVEDKLLPGHKHVFLRCEENVNLNKFLRKN